MVRCGLHWLQQLIASGDALKAQISMSEVEVERDEGVHPGSDRTSRLVVRNQVPGDKSEF